MSTTVDEKRLAGRHSNTSDLYQESTGSILDFNLYLTGRRDNAFIKIIIIIILFAIGKTAKRKKKPNKKTFRLFCYTSHDLGGEVKRIKRIIIFPKANMDVP